MANLGSAQPWIVLLFHDLVSQPERSLSFLKTIPPSEVDHWISDFLLDGAERAPVLWWVNGWSRPYGCCSDILVIVSCEKPSNE